MRVHIRLRDVCDRVGVGASTIYKMMGDRRLSQASETLVAHVGLDRKAKSKPSLMRGSLSAINRSRRRRNSRYLRMGEVMRLTGMTHAMIYDGARAKTFPKWADLLKRGSGWLKTDIEAWLANRWDSGSP